MLTPLVINMLVSNTHHAAFESQLTSIGPRAQAAVPGCLLPSQSPSWIRLEQGNDDK